MVFGVLVFGVCAWFVEVFVLFGVGVGALGLYDAASGFVCFVGLGMASCATKSSQLVSKGLSLGGGMIDPRRRALNQKTPNPKLLRGSISPRVPLVLTPSTLN